MEAIDLKPIGFGFYTVVVFTHQKSLTIGSILFSTFMRLSISSDMETTIHCVSYLYKNNNKR